MSDVDPLLVPCLPSLDIHPRRQLVVSILWEATGRKRVRSLHLVEVRGTVPIRVKLLVALGVHILVSVLVWI